MFVVFLLLLLLLQNDCHHYIMLRNVAKKFNVYYRTLSLVVFKRPIQVKAGHILCSESCFIKKKIAVLPRNCNPEFKPV